MGGNSFDGATIAGPVANSYLPIQTDVAMSIKPGFGKVELAIRAQIES